MSTIAATPATVDGIPLPTIGEVHVYADGACSGNPGPGGWGVVVVTSEGVQDLYKGDPATTNNRMEMVAATTGLLTAAALDGGKVVMYLDSEYVRKGITEWIHGWKKRGWRTADNKAVKNQDLWMPLDKALQDALAKGLTVDWKWVKGHNSNPGNERADRNARLGCQQAKGTR